MYIQVEACAAAQTRITYQSIYVLAPAARDVTVYNCYTLLRMLKALTARRRAFTVALLCAQVFVRLHL